jgi:hypothetical protein
LEGFFITYLLLGLVVEMNSDIRLAVTFFTHPKTQKLKRRLGDSGVVALLTLWVFAAQNRPDGNLHHMDEEDIELAACWTGEAGSFVSVLAAVRFIDSTPDGFVLHDWSENNPWAAGAPARREKAQKAAHARHGKQRSQALPDDSNSNANLCSEQDLALLDSAPSMPQADLSNAPILSLPKPEPKTLKPSAAKKTAPSPTGDFKTFSAWWCMAFSRVEGYDYIFEGGKDGDVVKKLLTRCNGLKPLISRACRFFILEDAWLDEKRSVSMFLNHINKCPPITNGDMVRCRELGLMPPDGVLFEDWKFWENSDES